MDYHIPVLLDQVLALFKPNPYRVFIDGTLGNGGHTLEFLRSGATVFGIESDDLNKQIAISRIKSAGLDKNFFPQTGNFKEIEAICTKLSLSKIDGILLDLGLSSNQQKSTGRGFSFSDQDSLDMRLDPTSQELTAEEIVNTYSFPQLFDIFSKIAQEKLSKPIAQKIITHRQSSPIKNAQTLADIIRKAYAQKNIRSKIDPSTKILMALRIVVNNEFENLKKFLNNSLAITQLSGATVGIITFHSGEDRIVKQFIREKSREGLIEAYPHQIATHHEVLRNPLSRSATLRSYRIN
jgi:16S rRNA (cytosine1402-N4)-methyltransferase